MTTNNAVNTSLSGQTGTTHFVGSSSPTITTPDIVTSLNDTNGNTWIAQTATASAVNYITVTDNSTTNPPIISATGSDTNILLELKGKGTSGVAVQGSTAGSTPASGYIGQIITSTANVNPSSSTPTDVTSISLTAGNWLVVGNIDFSNGVAGETGAVAWSSTTSATQPSPPLYSWFAGLSGGQQFSQIIPPAIYSFSTTTTVYASCIVSYSAGTETAYAIITAIRLS